MGYLSLVLSEDVEDILVDGVIAEDHFVALADEADHQGRFFNDFPVLTAEEVDLVLDGLHLLDVVVEGDESLVAAGGLPAGERGQLLPVCLVLEYAQLDGLAELGVEGVVPFLPLLQQLLLGRVLLGLQLSLVHEGELLRILLELLLVLVLSHVLPSSNLANHIEYLLGDSLVDDLEGLGLLKGLSVDVDRNIVGVNHSLHEGEILRNQIRMLLCDKHSSHV